MHIMEALVKKLAEPQQVEDVKARHALLPRMPRMMPRRCRVLWHDAGFAFLFRQDYAALSTVCVFVEALLVEVIKETREQIREGRLKSKFPPERLTDEMPEGLAQKIAMAGSIGAITKQEKVMLEEFTTLVRNRLLHGELDAYAN